jgi:hypothetical protein
MSEPVDFPESTSPPAQETTPVNSAPGRELDSILHELHRMKRGFIATAIEDAQNKQYRDAQLTVTFGKEDAYAKRLRESAILFREIGERLFGHPVQIIVKISGQVEAHIDEAELKRRQRNEGVLQNPAVKIVIEKMRGELFDVRENNKTSQ